MPTYEYKCDQCDYEFEKFQSMKDDPVTVCPQCHRETVRRIISGGSGLLFKGSGFYTTDYRSPDYQEAKKKESGTDSGQTKDQKGKSGGAGTSDKKTQSSSDGGKAESKPASKTGS